MATATERNPTTRERVWNAIFILGVLLSLASFIVFLGVGFFTSVRMGAYVAMWTAAAGFTAVVADVIAEKFKAKWHEYVALVCLFGSITTAYAVGLYTPWWWLGVVVGTLMFGGSGLYIYFIQPPEQK